MRYGVVVRLILVGVIGLAMCARDARGGDKYWRIDGTPASWTSLNWATSSGGSYTNGWVASDNAIFEANSTITYVTTTEIGNVTVSPGITVTVTSAGTLTTGGNVRTVDVGTGSTLTWSGQNFSTVAGTGFIKSGGGTWNMGTQGNAFTGGFTLSAGTVIVGGNNNFGTAALAVTGGTIDSSGTRNFNATSLSIGGNFTNAGSGAATYGMVTSLGAATRTITNSTTGGSRIYSGVISGGTGAGLTFDGSGSGVTYIGNGGNTYDGPININGATVSFANDGSFGGTTSVTIDGGVLMSSTTGGAAVSYTIANGRNLQVGASAGTAINPLGTLTYNGVIADKPSTTGVLVKQGAGTLSLGGVSTYSGSTTIKDGDVTLTSGNNRLPTGTTVSFGETGTSARGSLTLAAGVNQEVAGLNSIGGATGSGDNTVGESGSGVRDLTLSGAGTYSFGDGTAANSGVITGELRLVKSGSGTQSLGDVNTYSGGTLVSGGTLLINNTSNSGAGTGLVTVSIGGTLGGSGSFTGSADVSGTLSPGNLSTAIESLFVANTTNGTPVLTFRTGSTFAYEIDSSATLSVAADRINVGNSASTGNVTIESGVTLSLDDIAALSSPLADGTKFTLIAYGGTLTGTFDSVPNGGTVTVEANTYLVNYADTVSGSNFTSGNTGDRFVTLTVAVVPEPGAFLFGLVVCSLSGVAYYRRKRQAAGGNSN